MRSVRIFAVLLSVFAAMPACSKEKKKGKVTAALEKAGVGESMLLASLDGQAEALRAGSTIQSFTPSSIKLPIYRVSFCNGPSSCHSVYQCSGNTAEACGVELSNIDAFVDALNAGETSFGEGETFDRVGVQYCPDEVIGGAGGTQEIRVTGTVKIQGVDYATDPTDGLVAGTDAKETTIKVQGGCASYYLIDNPVRVSANSTAKVRMFYDASFSAWGGIAGGTVGTDRGYSPGNCAGSANAYVCVDGGGIVSTADAANPTVERYLLANTENGGSSNSPTAKLSLYFSSAGNPIGGIQSSYRVSGAGVTWGTYMDGGLGQPLKAVDATTVSVGEPDGDVMLANWFKAFKRETHTGTYTYSGPGNVEMTGSYSATRL